MKSWGRSVPRSGLVRCQLIGIVDPPASKETTATWAFVKWLGKKTGIEREAAGDRVLRVPDQLAVALGNAAVTKMVSRLVHYYMS